MAKVSSVCTRENSQPVHTVLRVVEGKLAKRTGPWQRPEDCRVFLPNHHDGDIDWATFEHKLAQLKYEAQRAFEQYNEVDPRHRLVAAELERRWNAKLAEVEAVQATLAALSQHQRALTDDERATILHLGARFAAVWDSPHCPMALRKTIIRTVVQEIIVNEDATAQRLQCILHWQGGSHTRFDMPKPQWGMAEQTATEAIELIRQMAVRYSDEEIARVLNRQGQRTGKGNRWSKNRVAAARRRYVINGHL